MGKDYYKILGLSRCATPIEIRTAYLKLAREWHPDLTEDKVIAKEKFQDISEAFEILSHPTRKKIFDELRGRYKAIYQKIDSILSTKGFYSKLYDHQKEAIYLMYSAANLGFSADLGIYRYS
ncbi:hypothetical protein LCGC14_2506440 [marine sediment metagenome]|uniref:J domain-containing protein n=1 Tax=marine sediment metagenome TaxID=412755 RepID=A0A0F9B0E7_9ZZZZ